MQHDVLGTQQGAAVRFGWGEQAALRFGRADGCLVVVDVLSFSTAVTVATSRGSLVYPCSWDGERARALAERHDAVLAVGRGRTTPRSPWSLSPAALLAAPVAPRLVLPSPNGSAILERCDGPAVAACLLNADAVAAWLLAQGYGTADRPVSVVAAGERLPDGSLRPAVEDLLGAGAVVARLLDVVPEPAASPEARAAASAFTGAADVADAVATSESATELRERGHASDVEVAVGGPPIRTVPSRVDEALLDVTGSSAPGGACAG